MKNLCLIISIILIVFTYSTTSFSKKYPNMLGSYGGWVNYFDTIKDVKVSGVRVKQIRLKDDRCPSGFIDQLEFEGIINEDTSFIVENLLEEILHGIGACKKFSRQVTLHSEGGSLLEGIYMGRVFDYYGVTTALYPGQKCYSACSASFIGGTYRYMAPDTELMVHAPYKYKSPTTIECANWDAEVSSFLGSYIKTMLGDEVGLLFWSKTMLNCGLDSGWSINADAARIFGITNLFD